MSSSRALRVADQMQRELAELVRTEVKDPRVGMVTFTGVEVTADLAHAKVFFTTLVEGAAREETLAGLQRAAGFLRSALGKRLRVHNTPELHFHFDASVERGMRLAKLIDDAIGTSGDAGAA
jgi:ribosome-binding factor A